MPRPCSVPHQASVRKRALLKIPFEREAQYKPHFFFLTPATSVFKRKYKSSILSEEDLGLV